ncbi:MAG: hypothetical protein CMI08_12895 [Oceanospirillaceae bacterium]|uniref:hypothetical protein n=1 Tax=unclassified Thalassolituus TaxID=2624967 RepID=UPI000C360709|nr:MULTISPECIES: hypothetical protein [unclassified Thalassolituus]MAY00069.1 hypothetical protein [Oceanospirillaceae bacterium]MBL33500.1 hypothetical protein [Oceanospirillaceae bacterium]MBS51456.1 hypothetical protein [Oceanospirillaceae bacterium]|tara:strand:- start:9854 stop:10528 length:675 start_codon:yes stop_codon:yes gene_type:complete
MKKLLLILATMVLTSCATSSGFNRNQLWASLDESPQVVTDADIQKALDAKPQLRPPFRLAVYTELNSWRTHWDAADKAAFALLAGRLKAAGIVSDVVYLNPTIVSEHKHDSIRLAAARTGADAVMIVNGTGAADRYNNAWGASYFLLITPFFIPGTVVDGIFMMSASMWDVRNDYLYLSAEAEGQVSETGSAFLLDSNTVINEAKTKAVEALVKEIENQLNQMQ